MPDDDLHDPDASGTEGATRPAGTPARRSVTYMVPEPGGTGLLERSSRTGEPEPPAPHTPHEQGPTPVSSIEEYAERRGQDSSHRFAPLPRAADEAAVLGCEAHAAIEERITLWTEVEANWRSLLQEEFTRDIPERLEHDLRTAHGAAADGLILALASRVCARDPSPENRQMLADLRLPYPGSDTHVAAILDAPPDRLPAALIGHLAHYQSHVERHALAIDAGNEPPSGRGTEAERKEALAAPDAPAGANDNLHPAFALTAYDDAIPPGAAQRSEGPSGEFDWREIARQAAIDLHREAAQEQREPDPEPAPTEREHFEATREQTDTRREHQVHRFEQLAREAAREIVEARHQGREGQEGREL